MLQLWQVKQLRWKNLPSALMRSTASSTARCRSPQSQLVLVPVVERRRPQREKLDSLQETQMRLQETDCSLLPAHRSAAKQRRASNTPTSLQLIHHHHQSTESTLLYHPGVKIPLLLTVEGISALEEMLPPHQSPKSPLLAPPAAGLAQCRRATQPVQAGSELVTSYLSPVNYGYPGRFYCEMHSEDLLFTSDVEASCEDINEDEDNGVSSESYTLSPSDEEYFLKPESVSSAVTHSDDQEEPDQIIHQSKGNFQEPLNTSTFPDPASKPEILEPTQDEPVPFPVPKPRLSRQTTPTCEPSPPVAKPRKVILTPQTPFVEAAPEETSKAGPDVSLKPLRKLQLSIEERNELGNLQSFSADSDSETQGGSSSCSSSSANAGGPPKQEGQDGQEEEGYWSGSTASLIREKKNRHCFKKKEMPSGQNRVRSKFSPWNLSSPRISRDCRLTVHPGRVETTFHHVHSTSEDGVDDDDDDDDDEDYDMFDEQEDLFDMKLEPSDPVQAKKFELRRMKTLQRRAKMSVMDRFCKAQSIQRRLEEIEVSYKDLEEKGVKLERSLRRQPNDNDSSETIEEWIQLVHEKNALVSEESDLMVESRQLELEDKRSTLELEYRKLMEMKDKTPEQEEEENQIFQQILEVVEMMDSLVTFLDEKRQKEMSENEEALSIKEAKRHSKAGAQVQWA
ncbi:hypothetical protein CCH79_00006382 [Gambusia affinis]|uniref:BMERB domain-containing protein n=1 Tax=Gambusia affinis TaxID=33528 RepID=A0A315W7K1_GAMAF|nr:hypothetical protein CCH79_00006382 [Gambusia affinis]